MNRGFSSPRPFYSHVAALVPARSCGNSPARHAAAGTPTVGGGPRRAPAAPRLALTMVLLAALATLSACRRKDDRGDGEPIKGKASDPAVTFAARWDDTNAYLYHLESITGTQVPRRNSDVVIQQDTVLAKDLRFGAHSVGQDGGRTVRVEVQSARVETTADQRLTSAFDTENEMLSTEDNAIATRLRNVKGALLAFRLSPANRVVRVDGMKDFNDRVGSNRSVRGAAGAVLDRFFNQQFYRDLIEMSFLPTNEVHVGDTWTQPMRSGVGLYNNAPVDVTYTFRGWQHHDGTNCARFDYAGSSKGGRGGSPGNRPAASSEDAEIEGTIWFSPDLGVPIELFANQSITRQTVTSRVVQNAGSNTLAATVTPSTNAAGPRITSTTTTNAAGETIMIIDTDDSPEPPATGTNSPTGTAGAKANGTVVTSSRTTTTKQHYTLTLVEIVPVDPAVEAAAPSPAPGSGFVPATSRPPRVRNTRRNPAPAVSPRPTANATTNTPRFTPKTDAAPVAAPAPAPATAPAPIEPKL